MIPITAPDNTKVPTCLITGSVGIIALLSTLKDTKVTTPWLSLKFVPNDQLLLGYKMLKTLNFAHVVRIGAGSFFRLANCISI